MWKRYFKNIFLALPTSLFSKSVKLRDNAWSRWIWTSLTVLRLPKQPSLELMEKFVGDLLRYLAVQPIEGRLRIVEPNRVRIHE